MGLFVVVTWGGERKIKGQRQRLRELNVAAHIASGALSSCALLTLHHTHLTDAHDMTIC